jgi:hypothetical protein
MGRPLKERTYFLGLVVFIARAGSLDRVLFSSRRFLVRACPLAFCLSHRFRTASAWRSL